MVDDGSTDKTGEIARSYGADVTYVRQKNAGPGAARNTGIETASCEWIAFLDSDDEWIEDNLELLVELIERNPRLSWAFANFFNYYSDTGVREPAHCGERTAALFEGREYCEDYLDVFGPDCYAWLGALLIRRDVLRNAGGFNTQYWRGEDTDLLLNVAYIEPAVGYIAKPLAVYHKSVPGSLSKSNSDCKIIGDIVEKHLGVSGSFGKRKKFERCGRQMLCAWIREEFCAKNAENIWRAMKRFEWLLGWRFKAEMRLRAKYPGVAALLLRLVRRGRSLVRLVTRNRSGRTDDRDVGLG